MSFKLFAIHFAKIILVPVNNNHNLLARKDMEYYHGIYLAFMLNEFKLEYSFSWPCPSPFKWRVEYMNNHPPFKINGYVFKNTQEPELSNMLLYFAGSLPQ